MRSVLVAVGKREFLPLVRLTYSSQNKFMNKQYKKIENFVFKVLTAISCPLNALARFAQCSVGNLFQIYAIGIQKFSKT